MRNCASWLAVLGWSAYTYIRQLSHELEIPGLSLLGVPDRPSRPRGGGIFGDFDLHQ
jgi:hypothetical protein